MNKPKQDVAVFIDFENIYVSVREKFDATPNFEALMERCEDYGRVVVARAYADWYRYPRITSALFANNIEPMYVPTYYYDKDEGRMGRPIKNSVDMHMCIDAMRTLYTRTNIGAYIFITGDRDFIALVNCVRQEGKDVIIVGIGGAASSHLAQSADEFLFYEQIVDIRPMGGRRNERHDRSEKTFERVERPERVERNDRAERPERSSERNERNDRSSERGERNGRDERRRDRSERPEKHAEPHFERLDSRAEKSEPRTEKPVEKPAEIVVRPAPSITPVVATTPSNPDAAIYDKLVEALHLARKRGYVTSFGSLKVLMKELMPNFKESRYRDVQGKPFTKFTDFVREAERLGKIQIFTSGTVNEVFLPDEDPYKLSQFAEDLPSVEAERELEQELELQAEAIAPITIETIGIADEPMELSEGEDAAASSDRGDRNGRRRRRRGSSRSEQPTADIVPDELSETVLVPALPEGFSFGEREWQLFYQVMGVYSEPVPFADIFNDLREMRNTAELELTNNALKELIKQAINEGKVQRSNRGAKAHYRLVLNPEQHDAAGSNFEPSEHTAFDDGPNLPDLVDEEPRLLPAMIGGQAIAIDDDYTAPIDEVALPESFEEQPLPDNDADYSFAEPIDYEAPVGAATNPAIKPRKPSRRRKSIVPLSVAEAIAANNQAEPVAEPVVEAVTEPVGEVISEPVAEIVAEPVVEAVAEPVAEKPKKRGGKRKAAEPAEVVEEKPKKTTRRKKAEPVAEAPAPAEPAKPRRRKKVTPSESGEQA
ncbi:NYN domain-containing protein [Herpetosiphon giganteus]|uniref:NYN domain-containing protein n=1 Tax=Herpetosiphon giganteus TaxID=2029754 RepID=UPI00195C80B4|nr:NYN domain-containing protein [Herpetosiphon giganteus]MBM7845992.1 uncharacterized protein (TIGR00288 family) [Herpetosiphon giganteus]